MFHLILVFYTHIDADIIMNLIIRIHVHRGASGRGNVPGEMMVFEYVLIFV